MLERQGLPPINGVESVEAVGGEVKNPPVVETTHTLQDMARDFAFFGLGVLVKNASWMGRDVIKDITTRAMQFSGGEAVVCIDYQEPFFHGLGQVSGINLDRRIWAVPLEYADTLTVMLRSCAAQDLRTGFFAQLRMHASKLVDPFAIRKKTIIAELPYVDIMYAGLLTTAGYAYIEDRPSPLKPRYVTGTGHTTATELVEAFQQRLK